MSLWPNWDRNKVEPSKRTKPLGCGNDRYTVPMDDDLQTHSA